MFDISNRMERGRLEIFSKPVKNLWNNWDIRVFVLSSLLVQILLIFFAAMRKRRSHKMIILFTWSLYLLADWVADFALGLLANSQGNDESDCPGGNNKPDVKIMASSGGPKHNIQKSTNNNILAFWAPFLLLHLGGPDTITAFAMEDNELWLRHLLGVIFEVGAAGYVFLLSLPKNRLLVPTLLIFIAGIIKYGERTYALYLASMDGFRDSMLKEPDPGPNYAKLMEEYQSKIEAGVPAQIVISPEPETHEIELEQEYLNEERMVRKAYEFFKTFKGLIVDLMFSFRDRAESRNDFLRWSPMHSFRVIEHELEFVYEVLFTKAAVIHSKRGYILRAICSFSIVVAFFLFFFTNKQDFLQLDVVISYTLLGGAIALDFMAFIMLLLSDWSIIKVKIPGLDKILPWIITKVPPYNQWSVSIMQYNLIDFCIPNHHKYWGRIADRTTYWGKFSEMFYIQKVLDCLHCKMISGLLQEMQYTYNVDVSEELKTFIYDELKKKTEIMKEPKAARSLCSCRGNWALEQNGYFSHFKENVEVEFDESLLRWHIATTLCYYTEEDIGKIPIVKKNTSNASNDLNKENEAVPISAAMHRQLSKFISDYMIYLLIMQPSMMSSSAVIGKIRFRDTCAEAKNFFLRKPFERWDRNIASALCSSLQDVEDEKEKEREAACKDLLSVNTEARPIDVKGDRSKSVLFDACILAKKLKEELKEGQRWALIGEVWVEMLSYTASKCDGIAHAQRLSKGGELLTFVWFLMAHLGLGEQYRIEAGHARAKLIVGK
ncbi:uncharacterized protein LOC131221865 [Magnolia sinica]|uniref:uncharacterized protein LOC131221865 n=1 Tax=Magnolia sinica TaxID=86752 RepID=UPI002659B5F3|nr:uncharacterized protein LOC131221865 [Magnolia sinica]